MGPRFALGVLLLSLLAAGCGPTGSQPRFNTGMDPAATPLPTPTPGRVIATLADRIVSFDVSPDARILAIAIAGDVRLYDLHDYHLLRRLSQPASWVTAVAWSPDGSKLAVGGSKDYGKPFYVGGDSTNSWKAHLTIYDASTWQVVLEPEYGRDMVNQSFRALAWSPNSQLLAYSLEIGGVEVIDARTGQLLSEQMGFAGTVVGVAWSPDGSRLLATGDTAYGLRRWRVSDNVSVRLFDERMSNSSSVAWSPDGTRIASGDYQGNVCLWTAATNRCDGFIHAHFTTFGIAWSPDGNQIATVGGIIRIWDTHTGKLIRSFGEDNAWVYNEIEWSSSGQQVVTLQTSLEDQGNTVLRIWDVARGSILAEFRGQQA